MKYTNQVLNVLKGADIYRTVKNLKDVDFANIPLHEVEKQATKLGELCELAHSVMLDAKLARLVTRHSADYVKADAVNAEMLAQEALKTLECLYKEASSSAVTANFNLLTL